MSSFTDAVREIVIRALDLPADTNVVIGTPPDPAMGDYAVPMFPFAKVLRNAPPRLAQQVVAAFEAGNGLVSATAAGPFVNFRLDRGAFLKRLLAEIAERGPSFGHAAAADVDETGRQRTVVIDYGSPNISKHLAYHHIRSTGIGKALCAIHSALGRRVIGFNFLGDWGTTHGMLIAAWKTWGEPEGVDLAEDGVTKLNELYVRYRNAIKEDAAFDQLAREWFAKLEAGDAEARALWTRFRDVSLAEFEEVFSRLGVTFDALHGESFYEDRMEPVLATLDEKGLTTVSDGALVVDLEDTGMPPCLLRKQDGATLYATRDIASAVHRYEEWGFDQALYVVGKGQSLHFKQLFAVIEKAGYPFAGRMEHVAFGQIRFGGVKTSSRGGNVTLLHEVLDRAADEIEAVIAEKNPDMPQERRRAVARQVGYGAIVFADLSRERAKDVEFDWERLLSFEGDTGPYCQYQHARIASIVRKAGIETDGADPALLTTDAEWHVALLLAELPEKVRHAGARNEPHWIAGYAIDLCRAFSTWYSQGNKNPELKVNCDDKDVARARLALAKAVQQALANTLALIGLAAPEEM
jgi:arginyl-tRNA synthetase